MFVRLIIRTAAVVALALVFWSGVARPSDTHGSRTIYRVKPYDTLWAIASSHYGGDVRNAIWQIQSANHLPGAAIAPGETLILP